MATMFACEFKLFPRREIPIKDFVFDLWMFIGALQKGGQITNEDHVICGASCVRYACVCPEKKSLDPKHHSAHARRAYEKLLKLCLRKPRVSVLGEMLDFSRACDCKVRPFLVLFTHYLDSSSPVACGKCCRPVPLYQLPRPEIGAYDDLLRWQKIYRNCDALFVSSQVGERFGNRQISGLQSELTRLGRELCASLEKRTALPVYYYLSRYYGTTARAESKRHCPGCRSKWLLNNPIWIFDFCCKSCRLLSSIASDLR